MTHRGDDVCWRIRLRSAPDLVFELLATDAGRVRFWVRESSSRGPETRLVFTDGTSLRCEVLEFDAPRRFALTYFEGSRVDFELEPNGEGTDLTVREAGAPADNVPGWVSVLMNLKAVADFGVDLRHGDPRSGWGEGYVDV